MPIYEYECQACGHQYEVLQKMSDEALTECPECKKHELKKLISAAGFRLKGAGWYETDFKSSNKKNLHGDKSKTNGESKGSESKGSGESKSSTAGGSSGGSTGGSGSSSSGSSAA